MKHTGIAIAAAGLAAAFSLSACGAEEEPAEPDPTTSEAATEDAEETTGEEETTEADMAVPELLDFTAVTLDGEDFEGSSLAGDPTVLWFWEHDCPVCQGQGGAVSGLFETYGDQVDIVGVAGAGLYATGSTEDRQGFVDQTGTGSLVHLEDVDYELRTSFEVVSQSVYVVLDADGEVVENGSLSESDLNDAVASTL
ncbi:redoxin domain-containing protein [Glycomyces salinus]|uniref:redoxin domain-containing protein n=1 Tax=Glycomyces salinus TaxID=980294 RepID=UPI0018EC7E37|nr:redoxin domain-containing protein [Glycomyces salinus]